MTCVLIAADANAATPIPQPPEPEPEPLPSPAPAPKPTREPPPVNPIPPPTPAAYRAGQKLHEEPHEPRCCRGSDAGETADGPSHATAEALFPEDEIDKRQLAEYYGPA
jgi:hypothetical protein